MLLWFECENVCNRLACLNSWSSVGGPTLRGCGMFWDLADRCRPAEAELRDCSPASAAHCIILLPGLQKNERVATNYGATSMSHVTSNCGTKQNPTPPSHFWSGHLVPVARKASRFLKISGLITSKNDFLWFSSYWQVFSMLGCLPRSYRTCHKTETNECISWFYLYSKPEYTDLGTKKGSQA